MKTSLSYQLTADGENEFSKLVNASKKWIEENINGPLRLRAIIQLKALPPEDEDVSEITKTAPLKLRGRKKENDENE